MLPRSSTVADRVAEACMLEARACELAGEVRDLLQQAAALRAGARDGHADEQRVVEEHGDHLGGLAGRTRAGLLADARAGRPRALVQEPATCIEVKGEAAVLLKVPEAAKLASMTQRALRHVIQRGQLPRGVVIHRGRGVFIDREKFCSAVRRDRAGRS